MAAAAPRKRMALAVVVLGALAWAAFLRPANEAAVLTLDERYLQDDRVASLIYDCNFGRTFTEPTTDMLELLVSKLEMGQRDPLQMAKRELAEQGQRAIEPMRRLFDAVYQDPWKHGVLENVLAVCGLMKEPWGLDIMRYALGHPQESVRQAAIRGLGVHGEPEDYDLLLAWVPIVHAVQLRAAYVACMGKLDPERMAADGATWMEQGLQSEMYPYVISNLLAAEDPDTAARLRAVTELRDEVWGVFLLAPSARLGDAEALEYIYRKLNSERPGERQFAVQVLGAIGRTVDTITLFKDKHPGIRALVAQLLVDAEPTEEVDAWLREGIADGDERVREACLSALVARADEYAVAHALALLEGNLIERGLAMRSLRGAWESVPDAPARALERLQRLYEEHAATGQVPVELLQTIGQVPGRVSAEFLMELAETQAGRIKGLDAFRWFVGQIWNTGPEGRRLLQERLAVETDPFRRLALIEFIWQDREDSSRDVLLALVEDEQLHPYERLFAGDRLLRLGPAELVASTLKRVYLSSHHRYVRPALQCLLWTWYGQHYDAQR